MAQSLASRGAQLVLLTHHPLNDPFLVDYILDLRERTSNDLITAEHVDLSSLHSIRLFATKWIDNSPPRRLDMVLLCADTRTPWGGVVRVSADGVEESFAVNYLANFQLLRLLAPALKAQPADRDVRVVVGTCGSYVRGQIPSTVPLPTSPSALGKPKTKKPAKTTPPPDSALAYSSSKLALMTFAQSLQTQLSTYPRPDKQPSNARVILVDPGWTRTPGMRRHLSFGSLWGLALYMIMYPLWWLLLKSPEQGAETFLYAAMEEKWGRGEGGWLLKECREVECVRKEVMDEDVQERLWELSEKAVEVLEKEGAVKRAGEKKEREEKGEVEEVGGENGTTKPAGKVPGSRRSRKAA